MDRVPGSFNSFANYEVLVRKPFDARQLVPSYESLLDVSNWNAPNGTSIVYNGLLVAVSSTSDTSKNGVYRFFDPEYTPLRGGDVTKEENWHKLSEGADLEGELSELDARIDAIENIDLLILDGGTSKSELL